MRMHQVRPFSCNPTATQLSPFFKQARVYARDIFLISTLTDRFLSFFTSFQISLLHQLTRCYSCVISRCFLCKLSFINLSAIVPFFGLNLHCLCYFERNRDRFFCFLVLLSRSCLILQFESCSTWIQVSLIDYYL